MLYLPSVEVEPQSTADASIIWLHGLGANGHDFEPIVPELNLPNAAAVRFVFPHAPSIPVTINEGMVMPAWYDILSMDMDRKIDTGQILKSADSIRALIDREIDRGIDSKRILIVGFSQGGAVGYQVALTCPFPLGGMLALSTYLASTEIIKPHEANQNIPLLICHGTADPVVPEYLGQLAVKSLEKMGHTPEYITYPIQHQVSIDEISDISRWFKKVLQL